MMRKHPLALAISALLLGAAHAAAQQQDAAPARDAADASVRGSESAVSAASRRGAARANPAREAAWRAGGRRLVVSVEERRLWWMDGRDTLFAAPVAVGKGTRLEFGDRAWTFRTPAGVRRVQAREANPVWTPPDWHYAELARDSGWALVRLERGRPAPLPDGSRLEVRGARVYHLHPGGGMEIIPADEEIIFGATLFMPPMGTLNRRVEGELGAYKLAIGDGYMLHGTPHKDSIGQAATHGCIRLGDEAIAWLYRNVAVGTPVHIF
jgi:L,D-transpeptidase catalytic domain